LSETQQTQAGAEGIYCRQSWDYCLPQFVPSGGRLFDADIVQYSFIPLSCLGVSLGGGLSLTLFATL